MYTPPHYQMNDVNEIYEFIDENSFGILITRNSGKLNGTHIPILLKRDEGERGFLYGHIAKANPQWKNSEEEVLVIFPGPHKYISSSWYETNQSVPTWNYVSVHVYGKIYFLDERNDKEKAVREVVKYFESGDSSYSVDGLKHSYLEGLLKGIIAFRIEITSLEGKQKLSQNHGKERQELVINKLGDFEDEDSKYIAERMKKNLKNKYGK